MCYIADNLNEIKSFAKAISNTENCLYDFHGLFNDNVFIQELKLVQKNKFIVDTITSLENESLSTENQLTLFKSVTNRIEDEFLKEKLDKLCKKNPDLSFFINYCSISSSNSEKIFSHVPLTTTMVEQTFSYYKNIFNEKRRNLKVESLEMLIGLSYNKLN